MNVGVFSIVSGPRRSQCQTAKAAGAGSVMRDAALVLIEGVRSQKSGEQETGLKPRRRLPLAPGTLTYPWIGTPDLQLA